LDKKNEKESKKKGDVLQASSSVCMIAHVL
jgi:hypothetical protein